MDMIERIARRLCAVGGGDPDASAGWLLQPERKLWQNHVTEARAVLEEMREPTKAMVEYWDWSDQADAADCWREMIAEELKDAPTEPAARVGIDVTGIELSPAVKRFISGA